MKIRPNILKKFCALALAVSMVFSMGTGSFGMGYGGIQEESGPQSLSAQDVYIASNSYESEDNSLDASPGGPSEEPGEEPSEKPVEEPGYEYEHDYDHNYEPEYEPEYDEYEPDYEEEYEPYQPEYEAELDVIFTFEGDLVIGMAELYAGADINAILLRGVRAVTESGQDVTHLITVEDDGGFADYIRENFAQITAPGVGFDASPELLLPEDEDEGGLLTGAYNTLAGMFSQLAGVFGDDTYESEGETENTYEDDSAFYGGDYAFEAQVTYAVVHPLTGEEVQYQSGITFSDIGESEEYTEYAEYEASEETEEPAAEADRPEELVVISQPRELRVEFMGIQPLNPAFTAWLQAAVQGGPGAIDVNGYRVVDIGGHPGPRLLSSTITIPTDRNVLIVSRDGGEAGVIGLSSSPSNFSGRHFNVLGGANLTIGAQTVFVPGVGTVTGTLNNLTLRGHGGANTGSGGGISISGAASVVTLAGGVIENNRGGNGPAVGMNSGTFNITGGEIRGNATTSDGGGISIQGGGSVTMDGGHIHGNTTSHWGGAATVHHGVFTMNGGRIGREPGGPHSQANRAAHGGAFAVVTHGPGSLILTGGYITGNEATGINGGGAIFIGGTQQAHVGTILSTLNSNWPLEGSPDQRLVFSGNVASAGVNINTTLFNDPNLARIRPRYNETSVPGFDPNLFNNYDISVVGVPTWPTFDTWLRHQVTQTNNPVIDINSFAGTDRTLRSPAVPVSREVRIYSSAPGTPGTIVLYSGVNPNTARHFNITGGGQLTLGGEQAATANNLTLRGRGGTAIGGGVQVTSGALRLEGGFIEDARAVQGGGVLVTGPSSSFEMSGGRIRSNAATGDALTVLAGGGGVAVVNGAHFEMSGGFVEENASARGGVLIADSSTFEMSASATIQRNTPNVLGAGGGGVVLTHTAAFEMDGGTIYDNTARSAGGQSFAGGITIRDNSELRMRGGLVTSNNLQGDGTKAGGVLVNGLDATGARATFYMYGTAAITEHSVIPSGGGVRVANGGTFHMLGDAQIYNNTVTEPGNQGGGVVVEHEGSTFNLSGNARIHSNRAPGAAEGGGGGVSVRQAASFAMSDGTIGGPGQGNTASGGAGGFGPGGTGEGGGVRVSGAANFTMTGGTISYNTAGGNGGGMFVAGAGTGTNNFVISGDATISNNQAVNGGGIHTSRAITVRGGATIGGATAADGNTATGNGGGIFVQGVNAVTIHGEGGLRPAITHNSAGNGGGIGTSITNFNPGGGGGNWNFGATNDVRPVFGSNIATGGMFPRPDFAAARPLVASHNNGNSVTEPEFAHVDHLFNNRDIQTSLEGLNFTTWLQARVNNAPLNTVLPYEINILHYPGTVYELTTFINVNRAVNTRVFSSDNDQDEITITDAHRHFQINHASAHLHLDSGNNNIVLQGRGEPLTGGGVAVNSGTLTLAGGEITQSRASNGGGVLVAAGANFTMSGGQIHANTVSGTSGTANIGAGVNIAAGTSGAVTISAGRIHGNTAVSGGGVAVGAGRTLTLSGNAIIEGNSATNPLATRAGGVHVDGHLEMTGGWIRNNVNTTSPTRWGGGVFVTGTGTFNMTDGQISGNTASSGGAVLTGINGPNIAISGDAHIHGNSSPAVFVAQGRTLNFGGNAIIEANNLGTNPHGGVHVNSTGHLIMTGGEIRGHTSSRGVNVAHADGNFTMTGGRIHGNTVVGNGGGVNIASVGSGAYGTITIGTDAIINGNTATDGGGIHSTRDLTISGNAHIRSNTATGNGGGVFMASGALTMTGGIIGYRVGALDAENNPIPRLAQRNQGVDGGGIHMAGTSTLNATGGRIVGNAASGRGGGIFMAGTVPATNNSTTLARLTTGVGVTFHYNTANTPENFLTHLGVAAFPAVNWAGANSRLGNRNNDPIVNYHLLNNYDVFWGHPFGTITLTLVIEGAGFGSTSVSAVGGTPSPITAAGTMQVPPGNNVTVNAALISPYSGHPLLFPITVTRTVGGGTPETLTLTNGSVTFAMPTQDTTITVRYAPQDTRSILSISEQNLDYGTHQIGTTAHNIRLGDTGTVTVPGTISFQVFNGTASPNWRMEVRSEAMGGNTELARRMFLEGGPASTIHSTNTRIFTNTAAGLITTVNWTDANFHDIAVRTVVGDPPLSGQPLQAELHWLVVAD